MIIIFPLSHEKTTVKRMPVITISLIIINVLVFFITAIEAPATGEKLIDKQKLLINYYYDHPYLDIPVETRKKLFSSLPELLEEIKSKSQELPTDYQINVEQAMIDKAIKGYEEAYASDFYRTYGHIPARGGLKTLLFSMFLHGGFFHLLFNMVFLFLGGYILEDYWGRVLYPLFYISGGVVATLVFAHMFPASYVPLVGASGAIAALMGAFFIRLFKTRIYFFYFVLIIIRFWYGRFIAPAFIMLPLWLASQISFALLDEGNGSGVAFWAHIGGFVYGCVFALVMKIFNIEDLLITHVIENKITVYDAEREKIKDNIKRGVYDHTENGFKHRDQALSFLLSGEKDKGMFECKRALVIHIKRKEDIEAMDYYKDMCDEFPDLCLKTDYQNKLLDLFEKNFRYTEAAMACKNLVNYLKEMGDKEAHVSALNRYAFILQNHLGKTVLAKKAFAHAKLLDDKVSPAVTILNASPGHTEKYEEEHKCVEDEIEKDVNEKILSIYHKGKIISINSLPTVSILSIDPRNVTRTSVCEEGLVFEGISPKSVSYKNIRFVTVFQFDGGAHFFLDLFVKGEMRPYRISSDRVAYADFFETPNKNAMENFRRFSSLLVSSSASICTDRGTIDYIEKSKAMVYVSHNRLKAYEKKIWSRLKDR